MLGFRSSKAKVKNLGTKLDHMVNGTNLKASDRFVGNPDFEQYAAMTKKELAKKTKGVVNNEDALSKLSPAEKIAAFSKLDKRLESPNLNDVKREAFDKARKSLADSLATLSFEDLKNEHPSTQMGFMEKIDSLHVHSNEMNKLKIEALKRQNEVEVTSRLKSKSIERHIVNNPALLAKIRILNQSRIFKQKGYSPAQPKKTATKQPLDLTKLQPKIDRANRKIEKYEAEYNKFMEYMKEEKIKIEKYNEMIKEVKNSKSELKEGYNKKKDTIFALPEQTREPSKSIFKSFGKDLSEGVSSIGRSFKNISKGLTAATKYKVAKDSLYADIQNETGIFNEEQKNKREKKIEDLEQRLVSFRKKIDEKKTRKELLEEVQNEIRENVKKSRTHERNYLRETTKEKDTGIHKSKVKQRSVEREM